MIYVTHDQVEAMTLADRIVVLRAGEIEQVGTPLELYDDPANLFVAGFIGSPKMNFLKARGQPKAERSDHGRACRSTETRLTVSESRSAGPSATGRHVRPRHPA